MQRFVLLCGILAIIASALPLIGCGGASGDLPDTAPVTGTVTYNGEPVPNAQVMFYPDEGPKPAVGTADENGVYSLTTFEKGDGAIPGTHVVTVTAYDNSSEGVSMNSLVPEKYSTRTSSPLKVTVADQEKNEIPLELTD